MFITMYVFALNVGKDGVFPENPDYSNAYDITSKQVREYLNEVKRSINASSTPLIILIAGSRLRLHS
jgi:hypothetical protein